MEAGGPCQMISRSVAQIATASMRTSTSARFGTGTGLVVSLSSPGSPSTHARMVSGTGMSGLVLTPVGAYIFLFLVSLGCHRRAVRKGLCAKLGGQCAHRAGDLFADQRQMFIIRPHRRRGGADRAHDGAVMVADRGTDTDHAGLEL